MKNKIIITILVLALIGESSYIFIKNNNNLSNNNTINETSANNVTNTMNNNSDSISNTDLEFIYKIVNTLESNSETIFDISINDNLNDTLLNDYIKQALLLNTIPNELISTYKGTNENDICYAGGGICEVISLDNIKKYSKYIFNDENYIPTIGTVKDNNFYSELGGAGTEYIKKTNTLKKDTTNNKIYYIVECTYEETNVTVEWQYVFKYNESNQLYLEDIIRTK